MNQITTTSKSRITFLMMILSLGVFLPGCQSKTAEKKPTEKKEEPKPAINAQPPAPAQAEKPLALPKRTTNLVVDKIKAMSENKNLVVTENKLSGTDPLTISASAYISISSKANVIAFQHSIELLKATEGRNPTYDEIVEYIKVNQIKFNALPDYQWYGYDQETGTFLLLQDPVLKKKLREQAGLPPE